MGLIKPDLNGIDHDSWIRGTRVERMRPLIQAWGEAGFGTPESVFFLYAFKIAAYFLGGVLLAWVTTPGMAPLMDVGGWLLEPIVWQKLVVFTLLFEITGFGCGSGPLTLRFLPPIGGLLYWLRPGTIRLAPWPDVIPLTGGTKRSIVDVLLYVGVLGGGVFALLSPATAPATGLVHAQVGLMEPWRVLPMLGLLVVLGLRDKTIFLAARSEVYGMFALTTLLPATDWLFAAKLGMVLIWWGAAVSKMNHHFPFVIAVMQSNHPILRFKAIKRLNYRNWPEDMRPSRLAAFLAHAATVFESLMPLVLFLPLPHEVMLVVVGIWILFHLHILVSLPMGVPLEWNVFMMYSLAILFGMYGDITYLGTLWNHVSLLAFVGGLTVLALGNLYPESWSFLIAMRYYAGNWATSMWTVAPSAIAKLDRNIPGWPGLASKQLTTLYGAPTAAILSHKGYAFRAMHSHGRALFTLAQVAAGKDHETSHVFIDGEFIAGPALGWNFGEGHLHDEQLMAALQERCHFEPGEVRAVMLEGQPFHKPFQRFRIVDAAEGELMRGEVLVKDMIERQPWATDVPYRVVSQAPAFTPSADPAPSVG